MKIQRFEEPLFFVTSNTQAIETSNIVEVNPEDGEETICNWDSSNVSMLQTPIHRSLKLKEKNVFQEIAIY